MINGMNIFYSSKIEQRLIKPVQNKGKGLKPVQTKKGGSCNKKCNKKNFKGNGLKI